MGGNMKVWIVVATWFWWNAVVAEQHTLNFTTKGVTKTSYTQFIEALRARLADGEQSHDIPMMRKPSTVPPSQRFVLVKLSNWAEDSITLAVDVTNAYAVAYRTGSRSFFLKEFNHDFAIYILFPGTERSYFSFSGNYRDLVRFDNQGRATIDLGMGPLEYAIKALQISNMRQQKPIARSLIVVIQMVAEAARFKYIEYRLREIIPRAEVFRPTSTMLSYENHWGALSKAIQQSNQGGVFLNPVRLIDTNNNLMEVDNTKHPAVKGLAICKSESDRAATTDRPPFIDPTVRISGRNGLCVDVKDGKYNNGNPIQLSPCKQNSDVNQLWTLRKDGTIRSNGMCLTTNGNSPGSQVMINDCPTRVTAATTIWQLWENGTIMNPQSGLVLSAESGNSGTTLTVQNNSYASRQGWLAGNSTEPFITSIVGFDDLCMQANGDAMWVVECESSKAEQKWALYPDGSIRPQQDRPQQDRDRCLTSTDNHSQGSIIIISSCSPGSEGQRWVFMNDGTILNLHYRLVMDVKDSDPSLHQIIISEFTGNPNQKWLPLF